MSKTLVQKPLYGSGLEELNALFQQCFILPGHRFDDSISSDVVMVKYWREPDPKRPGRDLLRLVITASDPEDLDETTIFVRQTGGGIRMLGSGQLRRGSQPTDHWVNIGGIPSSEGELFLSAEPIRKRPATVR